jgi:hypothetical protein
MKGACNAMFATFWQRLPHRDYDDLNPRPEHAEAVVQWQWLALWHMWEAAFGLALWHSGDSGVFFGEGKRHEPLSKKLIGRLVVLGLATSVADRVGGTCNCSRRAGRAQTRFPDAVQRESDAPQIRDRSKLGVRNGSGSAAHHFMLRCARDTNCLMKQRRKFRP